MADFSNLVAKLYRFRRRGDSRMEAEVLGKLKAQGWVEPDAPAEPVEETSPEVGQDASTPRKPPTRRRVKRGGH